MFGTKVHRAIAGGGIALLLAVGAGACGGGDDNSSISKGDLTKAVKSDKELMSGELKNAPDKVIGCLVDAAVKYGDKGKLADYIKGKGKFEDTVQGKDNKEKANKSVQDCE
ncbi:MAG TPA: hypothetical protein VHC49_18835 [Mycobacteriales bacterium]|nr:hypothetical protein [Mycobacteriales bacterium]